MYKNSDIKLELSQMAKNGDHKMKIVGDVTFTCENVAAMDPITFERPEAYITLPHWKIIVYCLKLCTENNSSNIF